MNPSVKLLIVDDEPIARAILEDYVARLPQLQLVASCANGVAALKVLGEQPVDALLLDINMPQVSGLSLLGSLRHPPQVIFTTAYPDYALESYDHHAVDYLLKPIAFERFLKAVNKLTPAGLSVALPVQPPPPTDLLFVKSEGRLLRIDLSEVQFIEGLKDYVVFHRTAGKLLVHSTMKALEERLQAAPSFLRIHKSHIVNLHFVREVDGNCMRIGTQALAIGATYREGVQKALESLKLL